jgi:hypothetical protein
MPDLKWDKKTYTHIKNYITVESMIINSQTIQKGHFSGKIKNAYWKDTFFRW